ncbi:MAG: GTP cyclohydrolase II [Paracoccus sp. (in: a-proteobacteria)]|nr:GTP cyclohydrolase II [Paracoccus sp. (in: a-proteobacteria)]
MPDPVQRVTQAVSVLRLGLPVVLDAAEGPALVMSVVTLTPRRFAAIPATAHLVVTARRAEALRQPVLSADVTLLPVPADARLDWLLALADPARRQPPAAAIPRPACQGPSDLHRAAVALVKAAELLPAALIVTHRTVLSAALAAGAPRLDAAETLILCRMVRDPAPVSQARVPMLASRNGRLHVFRDPDSGSEHYAVQIGQPDLSGPVLVRLHSACFTGDVLGSLKCDCGPQLRAALAAMEDAGAGILLYLNQEGRGIGLANKMRAYSLQDQGLDTVEANHRLGFEDDERDFRTGAALLRRMGVSSVRLLTNNPAKIARLDDCGIKVIERVPLRVGRGPDNMAYLETKARKSGHLLA